MPLRLVFRSAPTLNANRLTSRNFCSTRITSCSPVGAGLYIGIYIYINIYICNICIYGTWVAPGNLLAPASEVQ